VRSYGWLAVVTATVLSACSGGGSMSSTVPAAVTGSGTASDNVRQVECHVGVPTPAHSMMYALLKPYIMGTPA